MKKTLFILLFVVANSSYGQYVKLRPPVKNDYSGIVDAIGRINQASDEAYLEYGKLQKQLGEYSMKLHNDEETLTWFYRLKKSIEKDFKSICEDGSYQDAKKYAMQIQGELTCFPELLARIRTGEEYASKVQLIENRTDWSWEQKEEWKKNNPYFFVPIKNEKGNVIGGRLGSKEEIEQQKSK